VHDGGGSGARTGEYGSEWVNVKINVKGNGQECPFRTGVAALRGQPRRLSLREFGALAAKPRFLASLGMTKIFLRTKLFLRTKPLAARV
jgi:hypothetical protein